MKKVSYLILLLICFSLNAQIYFPPNNSSEWETIAPEELNWCTDKINVLLEFLEVNNTKSFILLKDGKIVIESYFNDFNANTNWYWASAGKTLTAFMIGIAQQENYLSITDATSNYLGTGWTSATPTQESAITVWNQLTMSSGLNDAVADPTCTEPSCLQYLAAAGTRWAYHNGPYTLLDQVILNATGQSLNNYTTQKLKNPIGMDGIFIPVENNSVYFSTARSMARFGLLALNEGNWNGLQILTDTAYFNSMVNTSQTLNESYGYLWWLNGKNSYMLPSSQVTFQGSLFPDAPDDMYSALGKNGQFINVIPSLNMVWIRMGDDPSSVPVPHLLNNEIWQYVNELECQLNIEQKINSENFLVYPNPATNYVNLLVKKDFNPNPKSYFLYNTLGQLIKNETFTKNEIKINIHNLEKGLYFLHIKQDNYSKAIKLIKE